MRKQNLFVQVPSLVSIANVSTLLLLPLLLYLLRKLVIPTPDQ